MYVFNRMIFNPATQKLLSVRRFLHFDILHFFVEKIEYDIRK